MRGIFVYNFRDEIPKGTAMAGRGRPPKGKKAMTGTQRQRRWRAKKKRLATGADKRERRDARMQAMAERIHIAAERLQRSRLYGVLYADPPWHWHPYSDLTGMDRAAANHYEPMATEAIAAMTVPAAPDCVLFLWATVAMLPEALDVLRAWGFTYKSAYAWHKPGHGTGYWSCEDQIELLLVGTRGKVPAPVPGTQPPQMQTFPRGRHSEKPEAFATMIASMFPDVPKLEMFARIGRPGWDAWGNEAPNAPATPP